MYNPSEVNENDYIPISVQADKAAINDLIKRYFKQKGFTGPISYSVVLNDEVELFGSLEIFDQELDYKMLFHTKVLKNGDLWLMEKSLEIGGLEIPSSYVLKFVEKHYTLPEWVTIYPEDRVVYVSLTKLELNNGTRLKMTEFDLEHDDIELNLLVPKN